MHPFFFFLWVAVAIALPVSSKFKITYISILLIWHVLYTAYRKMNQIPDATIADILKDSVYPFNRERAVKWGISTLNRQCHAEVGTSVIFLCRYVLHLKKLGRVSDTAPVYELIGKLCSLEGYKGEHQPLFEPSMIRAGELYASSGKTAEAIRCFERVPNGKQLLAKYFGGHEDPKAPSERFVYPFRLVEPGEHLPTSPDRAGTIAALIKRRHFERAAELHIEDGRNGLAADCYFEAKRFIKAAEFYGKEQLHYRAAQCYDLAGNTADAALYSEQHQAWDLAGKYFEKVGMWDKACTNYERAGYLIDVLCVRRIRLGNQNCIPSSFDPDALPLAARHDLLTRIDEANAFAKRTGDYRLKDFIQSAAIILSPQFARTRIDRYGTCLFVNGIFHRHTKVHKLLPEAQRILTSAARVA